MDKAHWWEGYPWRMIQTNMRQIDMEDINAHVYVEELKKFNATVVMINTGGIMASYDTAIADHFKSEYLHGDSLQKVMEACRNAGIRVIARMDFSKIRRPIYEKHPDWAYRTKDGRIVDYNGDVHACLTGGFQQNCAFDIIREVVTTLPIDGLFINMGGFQVKDYSYNYHGICHCENCKRLFKERFGLTLPDAEDMNDPVFRKYKLFQMEVQSAYKERLERTIHSLNPDIAIDGIDFTRMESNTEYKRALPFWQYSASSNTRILRGIDGGMVSSNTTVDFIGFFYRHVAVNPQEQELRLWQDIANFGGIDYYLIGRLDNHEDRSGYTGIQKVFRYATEHQEEYKNIVSKADVLLLRGFRWDNVPEERGWIRALTEAHILFDEIEVSRLTTNSSLDKYKAVILPGISSIPDFLARKLDEFSEKGGCVIASGDTGKYDGNLDPYRQIYPLCCMGVEKIKYLRNDMASAMLHVEADDLDVFDSYENDRVLYFGDQFLFADYKASSHGYLRLIPPHRFGPPERCYYTQITDIAGIQVNTYGKGKGILIPWTPGLLYYRDGYGNTFRFMRDLLKNIAGIQSVEGKPFTPMVEVSVGFERSGKHALIQLVNNTGHFGTSYFDSLPVHDIELKIPVHQKPARVFSQVSGHDVDYQWSDNTLCLKINCLNEFEGIIVKF